MPLSYQWVKDECCEVDGESEDRGARFGGRAEVEATTG